MRRRRARDTPSTGRGSQVPSVAAEAEFGERLAPADTADQGPPRCSPLAALAHNAAPNDQWLAA